MDNKKRNLIIWDFDGPIIDSRKIALELVQRHFHDVTEDSHRNMFSKNIFEELAKLRKKDVSQESHDHFLATSYWPRKMELSPVPGIAEVILSLSKSFDMVVNSSSEHAQISNYLQKNNLIKFFQKIYGNEVKSKEEKFKMILQDFKVSPQNCILITDTLGDVLEAENLNIPSIVVLWGYQFKNHFDSVSNTVIIVKKPNDIISVVINHFARIKSNGV